MGSGYSPDMPAPEQIAARIQRWGAHGPQGPLTLEIYPTLACNLDCVFCDTTDRHRPPVDELSTERWLAIIEEAAAMGVERVFVLGGGEPLLRRDTPLLLARIKALSLEGILTTNGTRLSAALAGQLIAWGWDEIHFSVDGPTPEIHDALRGQHGAFRRTVQAACRLAVRKRQEGRDTPRIALHFVITRKNVHTLSDMVRLGHALSAFRIDFDALIAYRPEQQALTLTPKQAAALPGLAAEALALADSLGIATTLGHFTQPQARQRGLTPPPAAPGAGIKGAPCLKAWHYLTIDAAGATSPCCVLAGEGGSAASGSLSRLWQSDPFLQSVRQGMLSKAPLPRCQECSANILAHEAAIRDCLPENPWPST
jgi:MoaA/NifB/PqqE/SkfB family radical SAM enzyme